MAGGAGVVFATTDLEAGAKGVLIGPENAAFSRMMQTFLPQLFGTRACIAREVVIIAGNR